MWLKLKIPFQLTHAPDVTCDVTEQSGCQAPLQNHLTKINLGTNLLTMNYRLSTKNF